MGNNFKLEQDKLKILSNDSKYGNGKDLTPEDKSINLNGTK